MRLYRYRNVKSALRELKDRTFYFATRDELNDPIEGYVIVYWQGDKPAWEGLFRNYICSLFYTIHIYLIKTSTMKIDKSAYDILEEIKDEIILLDIHQFDNSPLGNIFQEIGDKFLNETLVRQFIEFYGNDNCKCYTKKLAMSLRALHKVASHICKKAYERFNNIKNTSDDLKIKEEIPFPVEVFKKQNESKSLQSSCKIENLFFDSLELRQMEQIKNDILNILDLILRMSFPVMYVEQLKTIMYDAGYIVCFSERGNNSAMWGKYANDHKGVCLIYETQNIDKKEFISINDQDFEIHKVTYSNKTIKRNFFKSLSRLTDDNRTSWLTGENNIKSIYLKNPSYYKNVKFQKEYYFDFKKIFCTKMNDWKNEEEQRVILRSNDKNLPPEKRTFKYNIQSLKGIIFGIRTPLPDKFKIIQQVQEMKDDLTNFEFFQAEYDDVNRKICIRCKSTFDSTSYYEHAMKILENA